MRILIVKLSAIGDCLLASPVAQALRQSFPDAQIDWVVHPHCAPVVQCNPFLSEVITFPRKQLLRHVPSISKQLRSRRYDVALDLQGLFKSGLITWLSGASVRIGPSEAREGATRFYTEKVLRGIYQDEHVVPGYLRLAAAAGAHWESEPPMHMPFGEPELAHARKLLGGSRPGSPTVVLNPSAGKTIKQWPAERFGEVGNALRERLGAKIVITGAPSDRPLADRILSDLPSDPEVLDLTGKTNLNQLAALLSQVDLFIGGDTGPMHIAQAAGTRVLALFGPTDPRILGPRNPKHHILTLNLDCSPCRHRDCPIGHICLQNLEVEAVVRQAERLLGERT